LSEDITPAVAETSAGAKVAGYLLEKQIGRGGMAVVFRAHDERLDRRVALKLLAPALAADAAFRLRFIRESRAAAAVDHPNIIPVYDAGDADGSLFIAMRYVQGGDARTALREGGALSPARAWAIISQVAAALDAAHARGLVHRDVKPANMLLDASSATGSQHRLLPGGQAEHVYLSDFGISKQSLSSHLTSTGQFVGTLDYVAPEQIEGRVTDGRADQYSLACAAYELLSGTPPFRRDQGVALLYAQLSEPPPSITASRPGLSPAVDHVLATALAKTPDGRYANCSQFAAELGRALHVVPGLAGTPGTPDLPSTAGHPRPWPAAELTVPATGSGPRAAVPAAAGGQARALPPHPASAADSASGPALATPPGGGASGPAAVTPPGGVMPGVSGAIVGTEDPTRRPPHAGWPHGQPGAHGQAGAPGGWPAVAGQRPAHRPQRTSTLAIGVGVTLVVIAGAAIALGKLYAGSGPATSPSPSASSSAHALAARQAAAVNDLLTSSAASRTPLQTAVGEVMSCVNVAGATAQIQQVVGQRKAEYSKAAGLKTGALANGVRLKNDLMLALLNSLDADKYYLTWARHELNFGCPTSSSAYGDALNADGTASNAKQEFVSIWNPIAASYGLAPTSAGSI
jgi:serine/threonine-protein kinase